MLSFKQPPFEKIMEGSAEMSQAACAYGVLVTRSCQIKSHNQ